jgi:hypothetical protein
MISRQEYHLVAGELEVVKQIFSSNPPQPLSGYTRVAALAILFHALHIPEEKVKKEVEATASSILTQPGFYLFSHERSLLDKMFHDHSNNSPEKQVPIAL